MMRITPVIFFCSLMGVLLGHLTVGIPITVSGIIKTSATVYLGLQIGAFIIELFEGPGDANAPQPAMRR